MSASKVEPFRDEYRRCPVCRYRLHIYHYPRTKDGRDYSQCLMCLAGREASG